MLAIALLAIIGGLIYAFLQHRFSYWQRRKVPHEQPSLFMGNVKGIGRTVHFRDINARIYERFKPTRTPFAGMYLFMSKAVMILDHELIRRVLIKDFSNFHDRNIFHNVRDDPLTGHLLALEGAQWRAMRQKLSPTFTALKMKFMFPTVVKVAKNLVSTCDELLHTEKCGSIELKELCARFTTDVIGSCVFGIECNSLQDPQAEFRCMGRAINERPRHSQILLFFMITNPALARRLRMKFFADDVSKFFLDAVRRTVAYRVANDVKRNDFLDMLIELRAKTDPESDADAEGIDLSQGLTLEQMAAQVFVFFLAGFETSSSTMAFCLYELALNATLQQRLRDEIDRVLAQHGGELTYEALQEMHYLQQVLSETLRKYPLLPHLIRSAFADYPVHGTAHIIERGTTVMIPVYAMHHDPQLYPEPERFDPERFTPVQVQQRDPITYLPFGDGPRNCIGMRFGLMQAKIGLITLIRSYRFSKSPTTEEPLKLSKRNFLMESLNGIHLKMEKI